MFQQIKKLIKCFIGYKFFFNQASLSLLSFLIFLEYPYLVLHSESKSIFSNLIINRQRCSKLSIQNLKKKNIILVKLVNLSNDKRRALKKFGLRPGVQKTFWLLVCIPYMI